MAWRCFMATPTDRVQVSLRRYGVNELSCHKAWPGIQSYHNVEIPIAELPRSEQEPIGRPPTLAEKEDPRWPKACECGYLFHPEDHWQWNADTLYAGALDGKTYARMDLPPGAIWRCDWMEDIQPNPYAAPDGKVWALMMPSGYEWLIYGPSSNGSKWNVSGELPLINVTPSIAQQGGRTYHGYVGRPHAPAPGILTDDLDGRKFPEWPATA